MRELLAIVRPSRAVRQLAKSRRGSVLILCVVLIVVLALIGTAMLSGARIDRFTTQQHSANVQIEMLVEGARQIAQGVVINDAFDAQSRRFRPAADQAQLNPTSTYDNTDAYYIPPGTGSFTAPAAEDAWLAVLIPEKVGADVEWPAISEPLTGGVFESPETGPGKPMTTRVRMIPSSRNITYPDGTVQTLPAMRFLDPVDGVVTRIAGDADGDGIADCMLSRLLPGEINGVTWYVGWRVVDNAAKVNVNTAFSRERDYSGAGAEITGAQFTKFYPSAVGLAEMLRDWDPGTANQIPSGSTEMALLNYFRFNTLRVPDGVLGGAGDPIADPVAPSTTGTPRSDFDYTSVGDAMYIGLGRRIDHPGMISTADRWQAYSTLEMASLASRFTLIDPESSPTALEQHLRGSLFDYAVNGQFGNRQGMRRYTPNQAGEWYDRNFNFDPTAIAPIPNPAAFMPLRALLATRNGVSNWMPQHSMVYPPPGVTGSPPSPDMVPRGIRPQQKTADPVANPNLMPDYDGGGSLTHSVAKANVNTAKFGELWRAYWNVMVDQTTTVSFGATFNGGTPFTSPAGYAYGQSVWFGNRFSASTGEPDPSDDHPQHMFRSSLRDPQTPPNVFLPPYQQLLLRAAIAAANTEDLRDSNVDVNDDPATAIDEGDEQPSKRTIPLVAMVNGAATNVVAEVFGIEPQPFITEVYVNTQDTEHAGAGGPINPKGYVAIELYNPYPRPINISGWILAVIDRQPIPPPTTYPPNPYPNLTGGIGLKGLSYFYIHDGIASTVPGTAPNTWSATPYALPTGTMIPAYGYLVLDNFGGGVPTANADAATFIPTTVSPSNRIYVPNLHWVVQDTAALATSFKEHRGGELVLLRPVDSALPPALDPPGIENGNVMPIDSFDFTGIVTPSFFVEQGGEKQMYSWHYVRSNAATPAEGQTTNDTPNWKFVYPGRYYGGLASTQARHQATKEEIWPEGAALGDPQLGNPRLGQAGPASVTGMFQNQHTIQLAAVGFPGSYAPTVGGPNRAPFGGFARNADILQVTYIGAYRIFFAGDPSSTLELNSVTLDSCFANDTDADQANPMSNDDELPTATAADPDPSTPWIDTREQVGRFIPLRITDWSGVTPVHHYNDFENVGTFDGGTLLPGNRWRYRWAIDLFDYLTVQSPGNDYFPDVPTDEGSPYVPTRLPVSNAGTMPPGGVDRSPPAPAQALGVEDDVPVQGLININTAPAKVLAALPWLPMGDNWHWDAATQKWMAGPGPAPSLEDNYELAKEIVMWRDGTPTVPGNGPFTSPMDLYRVRAFWELQDELVRLTTGTGGPDDADGDYSPNNATPTVPATPPVDGVRHDFEEQFLLFDRVSNLITTRSDSFTVYLTVQGWSNVGNPNKPPELVAQRRVGFIIDRSKVQVKGGKTETAVQTQGFSD